MCGDNSSKNTLLIFLFRDLSEAGATYATILVLRKTTDLFEV